MRKAKRAAGRRGRRLRILFADEARFGRINRPRPCWAPIGIRPEVASQLIREYIYLYGAVSPKDGTCVYLIMPTSNTACFQAFLDVLARRFARQDVLLVLDATTGQNGLAQARQFTTSVGVTGIILTKLDGTAKGGIVVAISRELGLPIRFVGTGEQINDLVPFDAETYVNSLFD